MDSITSLQSKQEVTVEMKNPLLTGKTLQQGNHLL